MDNLDRLFRQLVDVLSTKDPNRVTAPFQISELYQSILPYRSYKKQLGFECNEDYEMAVLRLFAGESDYATVEPPEAKEHLLLEARSVNPNPGAFREFAAARVRLNETAVRSVQQASRAFTPPPASSIEKPGPGAEPWARFAPPNDEPTDSAVKLPVFEPIDCTPSPGIAEVDPVHAGPDPLKVQPHRSESICSNCNEILPSHRSVLFCPGCGKQVGPFCCPGCGNEIEVGWRFCVTCGRRGSDG